MKHIQTWQSVAVHFIYNIVYSSLYQFYSSYSFLFNRFCLVWWGMTAARA
ncbi:hypothetical protein AHF37_09397 [Paragonimus kellicotti]|nr:hypothetical protein AHF37_09397 [Paragonimus kellicotti]